MAIHFSILAWEIPWTEEPGSLQSMESQELDMIEQAHTHNCMHTYRKGAGVAQKTLGCLPLIFYNW